MTTPTTTLRVIIEVRELDTFLTPLGVYNEEGVTGHYPLLVQCVKIQKS